MLPTPVDDETSAGFPAGTRLRPHGRIPLAAHTDWLHFNRVRPNSNKGDLGSRQFIEPLPQLRFCITSSTTWGHDAPRLSNIIKRCPCPAESS